MNILRNTSKRIFNIVIHIIRQTKSSCWKTWKLYIFRITVTFCSLKWYWLIGNWRNIGCCEFSGVSLKCLLIVTLYTQRNLKVSALSVVSVASLKMLSWKTDGNINDRMEISKVPLWDFTYSCRYFWMMYVIQCGTCKNSSYRNLVFT